MATNEVTEGRTDFSKLRGAGATIGLIDSGVDVNHPDVKNVEPGFSLFSDSAGGAWNDDVGHGTACAAIIHRIAPDARIIPVKALDANLEGDVQKIAGAIRELADRGVPIINLSLGSTSDEVASHLQAACDYAASKGVAIVAAASDDGRISFPAAFESVIGVGSGALTGAHEYEYAPDRFPGIFARGDRQKLAWKNGSYIFWGGSSFAAPRVSAILALVREGHPGISLDGLRQELARNAVRRTPSNSAPQETAAAVSAHAELPPFMSPCDWIRKAHLYPFNKEMHSLIRFPDLLGFEIAGITDFLGGYIKGRTVGERLKLPERGLDIGHAIERDITDADTIILGHLEVVSDRKGTKLTERALEIALERGLNVYSFSPLRGDEVLGLVARAREKGLRFVSPQLEATDIYRIAPEFLGVSVSDLKRVENNPQKEQAILDEWMRGNISGSQSLTNVPVPVLGIFGTGPQQGKFTAQLLLRRFFLEDGYSLLQVGTEPQSQLFGFDFTFPIGFQSGVQLSSIWTTCFINTLIARFCEKRSPDLVIAGTQSGIVPYDLTSGVNLGLPTLAFMAGLQADVSLLVVNSIDPVPYVRDTIDAVRIFGKCRTIGLVLGPLKKSQNVRYGSVRTTFEPLTIAEAAEKRGEFEKAIGLPCFALIDPEDHPKMYRTVLDAFGARAAKAAAPEGTPAAGVT